METDFSILLPESLRVDLPEVDVQHEWVFCRIEALKAACFENSCLPINQADELLSFLEHHFSTEERIAGQVGLDFSLHAKVHRRNLCALKKGLDEVRHDARDVHSFLRYVEFWFERHILEYDQPFIARLKIRLPNRPLAAPVFARL